MTTVLRNIKFHLTQCYMRINIVFLFGCIKLIIQKMGNRYYRSPSWFIILTLFLVLGQWVHFSTLQIHPTHHKRKEQKLWLCHINLFSLFKNRAEECGVVTTYALNTHTRACMHTHVHVYPLLDNRIKISHQLRYCFICLHRQLQYVHTFSDESEGIKHENNYMIFYGSEMLAIPNMSQLHTEKHFQLLFLTSYMLKCMCIPIKSCKKRQQIFFQTGAQTSSEIPFLLPLLQGEICIYVHQLQCKYPESWEHSGRNVLLRLPGSKQVLEIQF